MIRIAAAAAVLSFAAGSLPAQTQCTLKPQHIVFETPGAPKGAYYVQATFGSQTAKVSMQVDTGSTGIVVAADLIDPQAEDAKVCAPPLIEYTSSGNINIGAWKLTTVTFYDSQGRPHTTEKIPVLAVTVVANASTNTASKVNCTPPSGPKRVCPVMLGVGFDRDAGTPDLNPFLHLQEMTGSGATVQQGYMFTGDKLILGMNDADVAGFGFIELQQSPRLCFNGKQCDWSTETASISASNFSNVTGTTLVDTGIDYIFVGHLPLAASSTQNVQAQWTLSGAVPSFTFIPRPGLKVTPALPPKGQQAFLNTGRTLLLQADYLYDSGCHRVGFRPHANGASR